MIICTLWDASLIQQRNQNLFQKKFGPLIGYLRDPKKSSLHFYPQKTDLKPMVAPD